MDITVSDEVSQEYHALVKNILCNREFLKLSLYTHHQWTTRLMHSINAVSYTHLDVYKRQPSPIEVFAEQ